MKTAKETAYQPTKTECDKTRVETTKGRGADGSDKRGLKVVLK